jgi:hypothetical protein
LRRSDPGRDELQDKQSGGDLQAPEQQPGGGRRSKAHVWFQGSHERNENDPGHCQVAGDSSCVRATRCWCGRAENLVVGGQAYGGGGDERRRGRSRGIAKIARWASDQCFTIQPLAEAWEGKGSGLAPCHRLGRPWSTHGLIHAQYRAVPPRRCGLRIHATLHSTERPSGRSLARRERAFPDRSSREIGVFVGPTRRVADESAIGV